MKEIRIRDKTLKSWIIFYIWDYETFCNILWIENDWKEYRLWQTLKQDWIIYIYIKNKEDLPTLVHEILHWVILIFEDKQIDPQEELMCYLQEFYFREILKKLK